MGIIELTVQVSDGDPLAIVEDFGDLTAEVMDMDLVAIVDVLLELTT